MKTYNVPVLLLTLALLAVACGGSKESKEVRQAKKDIPNFILNPAKDSEEYFFETGEGTSIDRQIAEDIARASASRRLALKMSSKVQALTKTYASQVQSEDQRSLDQMFESASKQIADQNMAGIQVTNRSYVPKIENGETKEWVCYVQIRIPLGQAADQIRTALSKNEEAYVRLNAQNLFDELEKDLARVKENE